MQKKLDETAQEYVPRRIIDSKGELKPRRETRSHIQKLPFDILSEIFILCSEAERLAPVLISTVCRQWRTTVISTPRAWTRIFVDEGCGDSPECASLYLTRSRSCPLQVDFQDRPCRCERYECTGICPSDYLDAMRLILNSAHRISCLKIDHRWAGELAGITFPQLRYFVLGQACRNEYSFSVFISRFEALEYLDLPELMSPDELDVTRLTHLRLRYLSIFGTREGKWLQISKLCSRTLHTLNLTIRAHLRVPLQWNLELPVLESLKIEDVSTGEEAGLLELKTPCVRFYSYTRVWGNTSMRVVHSCEMSQLVHLRTEFPFRLADYPQLQILQLRLRRVTETLVESMVQELETYSEATSKLHAFELNLWGWEMDQRRFWELLPEWRTRVGVKIDIVEDRDSSINEPWSFKAPVYEHACGGGMLCRDPKPNSWWNWYTHARAFPSL